MAKPTHPLGSLPALCGSCDMRDLHGREPPLTVRVPFLPPGFASPTKSISTFILASGCFLENPDWAILHLLSFLNLYWIKVFKAVVFYFCHCFP